MSAWRALVDDPRHGRLPLLLLLLTVGTGIVDAVSILSLGRVFVANMTGNVAFIGFAAVSAPGFSLSASVVALAGFLSGAAAGGTEVRRLGDRRARLLATGTAVELLLIAVAAVLAQRFGEPFAGWQAAVLAALCAFAFGIQNAVARRLAVPDLTTTVLTMTLTGIAADQPGQAWPRRLLAVVTMLGGAAAGAAIVLHGSAWVALTVLAALLAVVTAGALLSARGTAQPSAA